MRLGPAIEALARGMVVGVPTDTVYGLAVDPHDAEAVASVFRMKGRAEGVPLVVLAGSIDDLRHLVVLGSNTRYLLERCWPGPLTAVLDASTTLASGVGDAVSGTLAVRIPDHELTRTLLTSAGPLAVTSANRHGQPPAMSHAEAVGVFGMEVSVYVEGICVGGVPSTVADLTGEHPAILRQGPMSLEKLSAPRGSGNPRDAERGTNPT